MPAGGLRDLLDVALDPGVVIQVLFAVGRHDDRIVAAGQLRLGIDLQSHLLARLVDQQLIDVLHLGGGAAVDGENEVALFRVDADLRQGRPTALHPILAAQDLRDLVVSGLSVAGQLGAEQAGGDSLRLGTLAAADVGRRVNSPTIRR